MPTSKSLGHQVLNALRKMSNDTHARDLEMIDMASSIFDSAKDAKNLTVTAVKHAVTQVNKSAHQNPWYYVGAAAVVGFIGALFIRR